jgi:hypothetical protein
LANMTRGFLFGLGSFLGLSVLFGLTQLFSDVTIAVIIVVITIPLSILVVRAALRAPPNRSRAYAVAGWLMGFLIMYAVLLCIFGIVVIFSGWPS